MVGRYIYLWTDSGLLCPSASRLYAKSASFLTTGFESGINLVIKNLNKYDVKLSNMSNDSFKDIKAGSY